jgi:hypothetical protein
MLRRSGAHILEPHFIVKEIKKKIKEAERRVRRVEGSTSDRINSTSE